MLPRINNFYAIMVSLLLGYSSTTCAEDKTINPHAELNYFAGDWVINEKLSDDTDQRVEVAIKKAGGKVKRKWFGKKEKGRYRGGPEDQELYDRISYDEVLRIDYSEPEFRFEYADSYMRVFHDDGRSQTIGVGDFLNNGGKDFSFASWENSSLLVEARPRDGGYTLETYTLQADNSQLRVEMEIRPDSFGAAIFIVRIYDRKSE